MGQEISGDWLRAPSGSWGQQWSTSSRARRPRGAGRATGADTLFSSCASTVGRLGSPVGGRARDSNERDAAPGGADRPAGQRPCPRAGCAGQVGAERVKEECLLQSFPGSVGLAPVRGTGIPSLDPRRIDPPWLALPDHCRPLALNEAALFSVARRLFASLPSHTVGLKVGGWRARPHASGPAPMRPCVSACAPRHKARRFARAPTHTRRSWTPINSILSFRSWPCRRCRPRCPRATWWSGR